MTEIRAKDLKPGMKIGFLLLLTKSVSAKKGVCSNIKVRWRVQCTAPNCSERLTIPAYYLIRKGNPRTHCGCQTPDSIKVTYKREYGIWLMMRVRCTNPKHVAWKHYGGRGIKVCPQWFDEDTGFVQFLKDMGPAPSMAYSLDRIDPDGNYEPIHSITGKAQVRWTTDKEQAANKRPKKKAA